LPTQQNILSTVATFIFSSGLAQREFRNLRASSPFRRLLSEMNTLRRYSIPSVPERDGVFISGSKEVEQSPRVTLWAVQHWLCTQGTKWGVPISHDEFRELPALGL